MQRADLTLSAGPNDVVPEARAGLPRPSSTTTTRYSCEHFRATERLVARIFRTTSHDIILMQGEAVLGLEAAARSLATKGTPVLNLVSGVFGKGFGYWLSAHRRRPPGARGALRPLRDRGAGPRPSRPPSRGQGGLGGPLRDAVGHAQPGARDRAPVPRAGRGHGRGRRRLARGHPARVGGVGSGPARGGTPEVSGRPTRHVAHGHQPPGLGCHRCQPGCTAGLVPVHHRLPRPVARQGPLPVHARPCRT